MKQQILLIAIVMFCKTSFAQDFELYEKHFYVSETDTLPYRLLLPANFDASKKYPLIFFLHGAGERGSDNEKQLVHGGRLFLQQELRIKYPAIVVFPQCPQASFWSNVDFKRDADSNIFIFNSDKPPTVAMKMAQGLLKNVLKEHPVKKDQVYVVGLSMGGMGSFEIVRRNPKLFAAAIPICGGGSTPVAHEMNETKWWIFHGAKDVVVPLKYSEEMVKTLQKANATVKFTVYPEAHHDSWDLAFGEPELLSWLFDQHK